jgi:hypothetical protein
MIISNKLSQEESLRLITILEKHRSAFGYSLQDLKGLAVFFALIVSLQTQIVLLLESPNVGLTTR